MTSLRARIAMLLVVSIVGVVALATLAALSVIRGPTPQATIEPLARMIVILAKAPTIAGNPGLDIRDRPAGGKLQVQGTHILNEALRRNGSTMLARVTEEIGAPALLASVQLPDERWLVLDIPDLSPPADRWFVLAGWLALIAFGAVAVSLYFATILARPLVMLENAAQRVGLDGVLPPLPEQGSAEVKATARALNHLSTRLKSAMESRVRLVAAAGHDLRTPMTRMRLRAEFLPDEEKEKWLHDLDELEQIADSAIRLVREEADADNPVRLSLDNAVREVVQELTSIGLDVKVGPLDKATIKAGELGLRRALRNLLVNAATHGKRCRVSLAVHGRVATIALADDGPGIPENLIDKAFEPFFRVDPARRKSVPGAGLGLAIAKEIVERYGGSITLSNQAKGGLLQTVKFGVA